MRTVDRILALLKTSGESDAASLARRLRVTAMAVRQHLYALRARRLVEFTDERRPVGRPARLWRLAARAHAGFPDSHAELAVGVIHAVRDAFGEKGLERVVAERRRRSLAAYRRRLAAFPTLERRVAALARIRRDEGYMAAWRRDAEGLLLVENHCPIHAAARTCPGLCAAELELFRAVLGRGVVVERREHILEGRRRCAYRITPRARAFSV
jgi:predicted ArsR family transcriptional regulator